MDSENFAVQFATEQDIAAMVAMSHDKRRAYEAQQPQFWRYAGPDAEVAQQAWFAQLLDNHDYICLVAREAGDIIGFVIGQVKQAPEVYAPGGYTLYIDDFCVRDQDWHAIGDALLEQLRREIIDRDVAQWVVVCGGHDEAKRKFLSQKGLSVASEWYVGTCI